MTTINDASAGSFKYDQSHEIARSVLRFLEIVGILLAIAGVALAFYTVSSAGYVSGLGNVRIGPSVLIAAAIPGVAIAIAGLLAFAYARTARFTVDTAEMTRDMLALMRAQSGGANS